MLRESKILNLLVVLATVALLLMACQTESEPPEGSEKTVEEQPPEAQNAQDAPTAALPEPSGPSTSADSSGPADAPEPVDSSGAAESLAPADSSETAVLSDKHPNPASEGLEIAITGVEFSIHNKPIVTLTLANANGDPVSPTDLEGYGFTIAQLIETEYQSVNILRYQSLLVREVEGKPYTVDGQTLQPALAKTTQAFADSGGEWVDNGDGTHTYTFSNTLTSGIDPILATIMGLYAYKDGGATVANTVLHFVPNLPIGGKPLTAREGVVTTEACDLCHSPMAFHDDGTRREADLCLTCHTDQTFDPESGNSLDFRVFIHKIHRGKFLHNVQDGQPYRLVGPQQSVYDYSKIVWPQDVRYCGTCHNNGTVSGDYQMIPFGPVCGACHDHVSFETGKNHFGGPQPDEMCVLCHTVSFGTPLGSPHVLPINSPETRGVNFEIVGVEGAAPGRSPAVVFKITNNAGEIIAPAEMDYLAVTLAGPTSDYVNRVTETVNPNLAQDVGEGTYRYTFRYTLPGAASGTYAVSIEGYVLETVGMPGPPTQIAGYNPVVYVSLDGGPPEPRRQVAGQELCDACHKDLTLHGGLRRNIEYCVMCHNGTANDETARLPAAMPPESMDFKTLIHKIHKGRDRYRQSFITYSSQEGAKDYTEVGFPRNLADCIACHLPPRGNAYTYDLPLPKGVTQPTIVAQSGKVLSVIPFISAACTACHDRPAMVGHAEMQTTANGVETCEVCHGRGKDWDVVTVHR